MERRQISKKSRFEIFKRDSFTCQYCGCKALEVILEVDHIKPVSKGGKNEILNLITSCFDCNRGKVAKEISEKSIVHAQIDQLAELNEIRVQLDMLLEWKTGLVDFDEDSAVKVCEYFSKLTGFPVNETGLKKMKTCLKKYGYNLTIKSMETSVEKYYKGSYESVNESFNKIGAICNLSNQPEYKKKIAYIIGICRRRVPTVNMIKLATSLNKLHSMNADLDEFTELMKHINKWSELKQTFFDYGIEL